MILSEENKPKTSQNQTLNTVTPLDPSAKGSFFRYGLMKMKTFLQKNR
jgi:hypothetical protein